MNSLTSMKNKLNPINIYDIKKGSNIYAELKTYSIEINNLFDKLKELTNECYIQTAESFGLSEREKLVGAVNDDLPLEQRRNMLINREQIIGLACTKESFEKIISSYSVTEFCIEENPTALELTIKIKNKLSDEKKIFINEQIKNDFPTHLNVKVEYL